MGVLKIILIILLLLIIGKANEIVLLFFRYNCKKVRYIPFGISLFYIAVLLMCLYLEENNMTKFAYGIGVGEFIFQAGEWIVDDRKYRKEYSVLSVKISCFVIAFEWLERLERLEKESFNLLAELFHQLKNIKLKGIMIVAQEKREKKVKIMFLLRKNESSEKLDNICRALGKCEINRENARRKVVVCSLSVVN